MSGEDGGHPDMTRGKNDRLPIAAPKELRQRFAGERRHKVVKTRKNVEQRTDDAPKIDQIAADRELTAHEPVLPKDFDGNLAKELDRQRNVAVNQWRNRSTPRSVLRRRRSRRETARYEP